MIRIVPAQRHDVAFIQNLSRRVFSQYGPYDKTLGRWFLSGLSIALMAISNKTRKGFAMLSRFPLKHAVLCVHELLAIAVDRPFQHQGVGNALLQETLSKAEELHSDTLLLHTAIDNNVAQNLFLKHGFVKSETKPGFYPHGQDAVMMVRDIH